MRSRTTTKKVEGYKDTERERRRAKKKKKKEEGKKDERNKIDNNKSE